MTNPNPLCLVKYIMWPSMKVYPMSSHNFVIIFIMLATRTVQVANSLTWKVYCVLKKMSSDTTVGVNSTDS